MDKSQREKMLANEPYIAYDRELQEMTTKAQRLLQSFNTSSPDEAEKRREIIQTLFGRMGTGCEVKPPFFCDYGCHIFMGNNVFVNYDCVFLDCNFISIGDNVLMAPKVQLYTAYHPIDPTVRKTGVEMAAPIAIGNNVWIGGGVIICPGVTIGDNVTIGAGSVVTKSIPADVVAVGNPCRVLKSV
ncbi:MAG: sugar O-acetyltransferase [Leptolyngbyaceae cyanobacterium bins.302]|nr:sugar O-acetyltransferase [Leptolyngbyaceae cyanobacterium bins.302]